MNYVSQNSEPALISNGNARILQVSINPCLNGYIVNVGCQAVVFRNGEEQLMADEVAKYLVDPVKTTERYIGGKK